MFSKYIVVVSGDIDIRNYRELLIHVFENTDLKRDLLFTRGPLDVLDHASDAFSFGGKLGVDATIKHAEELIGREENSSHTTTSINESLESFIDRKLIKRVYTDLFSEKIPLLVVAIDQAGDENAVFKTKKLFINNDQAGRFKLIVAVDSTVDPGDLFTVAWQLLGNSDPQRDHDFLSPSSIFIDGTMKVYRKGGFPRKWPNVVCSDRETISAVDARWEALDIGPFLSSPSLKIRELCRPGNDEVLTDK
jgi:4-hydroxy-3-polyprenylbenzoate decarboxylase